MCTFRLLTLLHCCLLLSCTQATVETNEPSAAVTAPTAAVLQEIHDLLAEDTRLTIKRRYYANLVDAEPTEENTLGLQRIDKRIAELAQRRKTIHENELGQFEQVAEQAGLECSEEPMFGQPSYGIILYATATREIKANELLLFHGDGVYRTAGTFQPLTTTGEGWYFRPSARILRGKEFVVACIQDAPEEVENVKNGFMPNSDRARNPQRPYQTQIFNRDGTLNEEI